MAEKEEEESPPSKVKPRAIRTRHSSYHSEGEASGEGGGGTPITDFSQVEVGMRLEAKDKYGKWYAAKVVEKERDKVKKVSQYPFKETWLNLCNLLY